MSRPNYNEESARLGRIAERWVNNHLKNKWNYRWINEKKESKKSPDFIIFGNIGIIAGIECEMKNAIYKKYFRYGVDFIADKVDRLHDKRIPIYYYLVISDRSIVYYQTMKHILRVGKVEYKDTTRMPNEKFYRVQLENLKEFKW
jgi:hypothetical protein